jgi:aryl-alcohol dehydrogenase-like predicted oxidoreductase
MRCTPLGTSGLRVSLLGYGGWALGKTGWPDVDEKQARETVELCLAQGVTFFDTAPVYGFGRSERLLGDTLAPARKDVIIATKCGLVWNERGLIRHDLSREAIVRGLEESLKRLKTDYIDLYQIHWPDRRTPLAETLETLKSFQRQGYIRHIGVSNFNVALLRTALTMADIVAAQNLYNLLERDAEQELLPFCRQQGIGFLCYSPLAQGLLAGKIGKEFRPGRHDIRRFNRLLRSPEALQRSLVRMQVLPSPTASAALSFLARQPGVTSILVSMTRKQHLLDNIRSLEQPLT